MIRICICNNDKAAVRKLRAALETLARSRGLHNLDTVTVSSIADLANLTGKVRENLIDLTFISIRKSLGNADEQSATQLLRQLSQLSPSTHFIIVSGIESDALLAYELGFKFLMLPTNLQALESVIVPLMEEVRNRHLRPLAVKSAKKVVNVNLDDITFVETNKKGPIIHACDCQPVATRGTLQAVYERLSSKDERFVKAGGSFVLNLDNIRAAGSGSVIFSDGEAIILPVRVRKTIADQYAAYLTRS